MVGYTQMTKQEKAQYKKEWYENNKMQTQLNRIIKGFETSTRKVRPSTLEKYGLTVNDKNEINIPKKI